MFQGGAGVAHHKGIKAQKNFEKKKGFQGEDPQGGVEKVTTDSKKSKKTAANSCKICKTMFEVIVFNPKPSSFSNTNQVFYLHKPNQILSTEFSNYKNKTSKTRII